MLTTVHLDGALGKEFGSKWELAASSPREALALINANRPGLIAWIKQKATEFTHYRVVCEYHDGRTEDLDDSTYLLNRKVKSVRFMPVIVGSGGSPLGRMLVGAMLMVGGFYLATIPGMQGIGQFVANVGFSFVLGGAIGLISPQPGNNNTQEGDAGKTSNYFDGPTNTTQQGVPVQLIYGRRVMVGSQLISARMSIDQVTK